MKNQEFTQEIANFLSLFGDNNRIRILIELSKKEITVTELTQNLKMSKSAISHHLRILKDNRIIKGKKVGKNIFYSLNDNHVLSILNTTKEHIMEK